MSAAARRTRVAARSWVTRAGRKHYLLIRADTVGLTVIELYYIEHFDRRLDAVDEALSAVERELDVALLEADINEASDFRDRVGLHEACAQAATRRQ